MKRIFFSTVLVGLLSLSAMAGSVGGKITADIKTRDTKIATADIDIKESRGGGGKDATINSIVIGEGGKVQGDIMLKVDMKGDWILAGSGATVNSIVVK